MEEVLVGQVNETNLKQPWPLLWSIWLEIEWSLFRKRQVLSLTSFCLVLSLIMILVEFCRIFSWSHTFLDHPPQMDPFRLQSIFQFALFIRDFHSVSLDIYICFSKRELFFSFCETNILAHFGSQHRENCMALFYSNICIQILSCTWTVAYILYSNNICI